MTIQKWELAVFAVSLAIPLHGIAQDNKAHSPERLPHYTVKDLGTLGGLYSYAYGLNNAGVVAGAAATPTQNGRFWRRPPLRPKRAALTGVARAALQPSPETAKNVLLSYPKNYRGGHLLLRRSGKLSLRP
jgi:hypothetical protein